MKGRSRSVPGADMDLGALIDMNSDPELSPEQQAEARDLLLRVIGPVAEPVLRACGLAAAAQREARAMRQELDRITAGTQLRGIVTGTQNGHVRVQLGGTERVFVRPEEMTLGLGQCVYTDAGGQLIVAAGDYLVGGQTFAFVQRLEQRQALVRPLRDGAADDARQLALVSDVVDLDGLEPEDRVLGWSIDFGNIILVTRRLGPIAAREVEEELELDRVVAREEIVGLEDVLERVDRLFLDPPSAAYRRMLGEGRRGSVGAVFSGVPGCGKSMVAELLVGEVRRRGGRALYRTASHYLIKWVGEGAGRLRADFALLERAYRETGVRPLLVLDELEAIALDRQQGLMLHAGHLDVLTTLLAFLTRSSARMIGISNLADRFLDVALTRDGRLPMISFPATLGARQVTELVAKVLDGIALAGNGGPDAATAFGDAVSDLVFATGGALAEVLRVQLADGRVLTFGARDLATAATIADGIVRPTLERVAQRDLRAGLPEPRPLRLDELREATIDYFSERARTITRESVRSVLAQRIPPDQQVITVEAVNGHRRGVKHDAA